MRIRPIKSQSQKSDAISGFTLVELMVTTVVLGVIAAIATPNISNQLANARVKATAVTLSNALEEAKSESLLRRKTVMVSYSNNGDAAGNIEIEVEAPILTAYSGPALYLQPPPTDSGGNSGGGNSGGGNSGGGNSGGGNSGGGNSGGGNSGGGNSGGGNSGGDNSGGGNSGGGNSGGGNSGGGNSGGGNSGGTDTGGTIPAPVIGSDEVATYKYNAKSTISASKTKVTFLPNKRVEPALVYTICDVNKSAAAMRVSVSSLGLISKQIGGSCV